MPSRVGRSDPPVGSQRSARRRVLAFLLFPLLSCCTTSLGPAAQAEAPSEVESQSEAAKCVRFSRARQGPYRLPLAEEERDPALAEYLADFPPDVRRTVLAAGLEPALARLLRDRAAGLPPLELSVRRQAIQLHLHGLKVQLDATTFEEDCTGDLIEGVQATLDQEESSREIRWTVMSLVVGAAAAAAAGAWELADGDSIGPPIVGIAGGVAAGGLGLAAFAEPDRSVRLDHQRNLLTPIVTGQDVEHVYPAFVFRLLTLPQTTGPTPREALLEELSAILDGAVSPRERPHAMALLYGPGGTYDRRLVDARERMLDEVESTIAAFSRDLELLTRYLNSALGDGCIAPSAAPECEPSKL